MPRNEAQSRVVPLPRRSRDEREFLPAALEIIETPASPIGRGVAAAVVAAGIAALAWACIGRVDIIATATGRVVPVGMTKLVQPEQIGVVRSIDVADGDHVRAGQVLLALDPTQSAADRDRFARDLLLAKLDLSRLLALRTDITTGQLPDLVGPPADASPDQLAETRASLQAEANQQQSKISALDQQIVEKRAESAEAAATLAKLKATLPPLQAEAQLRQTLLREAYGNQIAWDEVNERLLDQQYSIPVEQSKLDQARATVAALIQQRREAAAEFARTTLDDLRKSHEQVSDLTAEAAKASEQLALQTLTAPIDGTVQQLAVHTIGGVVTPAEPLLVLVPDHAGLVVEAQVENKDVGFVRVGQEAQVKVESFNFTRYGEIPGRVISLSRDVVSNPDQDPSQKAQNPDKPDQLNPATPHPAYIARISLSRDWMDTETGRVSLGPGMQVTAEIKTGRRRIIEYLLSPLARKIDETGHER